MNKMIKKLLMFLILLCIVVLVAFAVELLVVNRKTADSDEQTTPPSGDTSSGEPGNTGSAPPSGGVSPSAGGETSPESPDSGDISDQKGKLYEMNMPVDRVLSLYADEELFEYSSQDLGDIFTYKGGGTASIEFCIIELAQGAAAYSAGFLDNYIDYIGGEYTRTGDSLIGSSEITGYLTSASKNRETYEAWIVETDEQSGFAVVVHYSSGEQKAALYEVLDTLELTGTE